MDRSAFENGGFYGSAVTSVKRDVPLSAEEELITKISAPDADLPRELFALNELDVMYQAHRLALWTFMRPEGRPCFSPKMLHDFEAWQSLIANGFGPGKVPLKYLVLGSRSPGVFCLGGDLKLFHRLIRARDRDGLVRYGRRCCEILLRNVNTLDIPMLTIGLVQGSALGGGFEALLSFDFIIAEKDATFGLPEIMFGLFPGMGAHALLIRKLGSAEADRIIMSNRTFTAQEMYDLGIVHELVEPGEGIAACSDFIKRTERRHLGMVNSNRAKKVVWNLTIKELTRITELWAEAAMELQERDLKVMTRLSAAQERLVANA